MSIAVVKRRRKNHLSKKESQGIDEEQYLKIKNELFYAFYEGKQKVEL